MTNQVSLRQLNTSDCAVAEQQLQISYRHREQIDGLREVPTRLQVCRYRQTDRQDWQDIRQEWAESEHVGSRMTTARPTDAWCSNPYLPLHAVRFFRLLAFRLSHGSL
jgi:hypothetical protein